MPYKTPISFSGNLTKNPELTFTRGGIAQCKFGVAKNTRKQNPQTKEWENGEPTFFNCTAWEKFAEDIAAANYNMGQRVVVTGVIEQTWWTDRDTQEQKSSWQVTDDDIGLSCLWASRPKDSSGTRVADDSRGGYDDSGDEEPW